MKNKFEEAITSEIDKLRFTESWVEEIKDNINALHQQAMKEKLKGILQSIKASLDLEGAMVDNSSSLVYSNISEIAKENNIEL